MNRITRKKNSDYTIISNVFLRDSNLSIKAKGFLAVVMGLPENWEFTINGICSILKEGKTSIYNVINELKENGYCRTEQSRGENGMIQGLDYTFYETPNTEKQESDYPQTENPYVDNPPQLNKEEIKYENNKEEDKSSSKKDIDDFVDAIYKMYPTKCPKRNTSLGKCSKDKERIRRLLRTYTMEQIAAVVKYEIDTKYGKEWMQNFSTFLNNFPDPDSIDELNKSRSADEQKSNDDDRLIINGVEYR